MSNKKTFTTAEDIKRLFLINKEWEENKQIAYDLVESKLDDLKKDLECGEQYPVFF